MKSFSLFTLLFSLAFASCSKEAAEEFAPQTESTTFTLAVDELQTPAQAKAATRATSTIAPARYVMEVWSEDGTQAENVFENGTTNHAQITSGNAFTVTLDKTKAYTCLFWADDNTTYNAASLKAVELNSGKDMAEAYHAKVTVAKGKNPAVSVTLKRAVAKITITETATVKTTDDLALKFSNIYPQFSVLDGAATGTTADWTKTIKPAATTGAIGTLYFFAKSTEELTNLKFTYATDAEKNVSNIPYQMNYATNIKGEYSNIFNATFTVTADDVWNTPDNNVNFGAAKVGDYYMKDGTWSSTYTSNAANPCIGIVFVVNADGKTGKIVGLTEEVTEFMWSTKTVETGATDENNGRTNMATIAAFIANTTNSTSWDEYPAFKWVAQQNGKANGGWEDANDKWYLPAKEELKALYGKYNGNTNVDNNVKAAVNASLRAIGATTLAAAYYWTSTEGNSGSSWVVTFSYGATSGSYKTYTSSRTRCVREF